MKRSSVWVAIALCAFVVGTFFTAVLAQTNTLIGFAKPLILDINQIIPITADVVVSDGVTATVPLTVEVSLRVSVSGAISNTVVVQKTEPKIAMVVPTPRPLTDGTTVLDTFEYSIIQLVNHGTTYDDPEDTYKEQSADGDLLEVQFTVENLETSQKNIRLNGGLWSSDTPFGILVVDNFGREFSRFYGVYGVDCGEMKLNPGVPTKCSLLFEVPPGGGEYNVLFQDAEKETVLAGGIVEP